MKNLFGLLLISCICLFSGAFALDHSIADDGPPVEQTIDVADVDALVGTAAYSFELSDEINLEVDFIHALPSYSFTSDNERKEMYGNKQGTMANVDFKRYSLPNYPYKKGYLNHYHRCESVLIDLV